MPSSTRVLCAASDLDKLQKQYRFTPVDNVLILIVGIMAVGGFFRILPLLLGIPEQMDFSAYYVAAGALNSGEALYRELKADDSVLESGISMPYIYPPALVQLLRPLALLSYAHAKTIWFALNISFSLVSTYLLSRSIQWFPFSFVVPVTLMVLLMPAVQETLINGQVNLLLLFLLAACLYLSSRAEVNGLRSKEGIAGTLLGLASAIKLYPAIVGFAFLRRRRFIALMLMGFTSVTLTVAGGPNAVRYFGEILPRLSHVEAFPSNQSIFAVMSRLFSVNEFRFPVLAPDNVVDVTFAPLFVFPNIGNWMAYLGAFLILITSVTFLISLSRRVQTGFTLLHDFGLLISVALLILPTVWEHYYVLLLFPIFALLESHQESGEPFIRRMVLLSFLFLMLQRYWRILGLFFPSSLVLSFGFFGALTLWATLLHRSVRSIRSAPLATKR